MLLLPAIDLMDSQVVRLRRGLATEKVVYSNDPVSIAKKWQDAGADWLHLVDLDAAFAGIPKNLPCIESICSAIDIPCQLGGGMRSRQNIAAAFDRGVRRVILGTKAYESMGFLKDMCQEFGGERIAIGIDAKEGMVAVKGWTETTSKSAVDLARSAQEAGAQTVIYTDIATDGMLEGPNYSALRELLNLLDCNLIASGGVSSLDDILRLAAMPGLYGAIIGKALYEGKVVLPLPRLK
jgi:phosphoribosylformimino-5-aminoimidazole carboxamide ribotide isomerase